MSPHPLRIRATVLVAGLLAGLVAARADRLPEHADAVVDYAITVRLDPTTKTLTGHERVTWRNPSGDAVGELWLHLYLNGFRNSESTFYRETGGRIRDDDAAPDAWGGMDVTRLTLADGTNLLPSMQFAHPDDDNTEDRTVVRVPLPQAVPPQGEVSFDVDFHARLPRVYARTGYEGDFFAVAQWFPKLGVYEPAGMRGRTSGGWNCHQFHGNSEFYADYGHFAVELTVPSRFVVGATGVRQSRRDGPDGTSTYVYEQADVHDFAWTADPRFVETRETFSAERDVSPGAYAEAARRLGRGPAEVQLRDVELILLLEPEHLPQLARHVAAAKLALERYGLWYGAYPYPTLTIVDAPAGGAQGVEYPTLIDVGTSTLAQHWPFSGVRELEVTLVHELGHQFWYGLVGSNEFEEAWLDEGFTSYATAQAMVAGFGEEATYASLPGFQLGALEADRGANNLLRRFDRPRSLAWGYSPRAYSFYSYPRPALVLRTLAGLVGEETMARIMRTYSERWRFRHPRTEDFYAVAEEVSGRDLGSFWAQTMERPGVFAPAITAVSSEPLPAPRGSFDAASTAIVGGPAADLDGSRTISEKAAVEQEAADDLAGRRHYRSVVELRQLGELTLPVEVELDFAGVAPERRTWDCAERWARWEIDRPEQLVAATIDPDHKLPLDASWLDNARRVSPDSRAASYWSARLVFWTQQLFGLLGL